MHGYVSRRPTSKYPNLCKGARDGIWSIPRHRLEPVAGELRSVSGRTDCICGLNRTPTGDVQAWLQCGRPLPQPGLSSRGFNGHRQLAVSRRLHLIVLMWGIQGLCPCSDIVKDMCKRDMSTDGHRKLAASFRLTGFDFIFEMQAFIWVCHSGVILLKAGKKYTSSDTDI